MKTLRSSLTMLLVLLLTLLMGCAAQSQNTETEPKPELALKKDKPMLLSGVTEESIDEEEAALLEDDFDDWEDEDLDMASVSDPLEWYNRIMFKFNDKLIVYLIKPVTKGYRAVTPTTVRTGVNNFFVNLLFPIRLVNCLLQGKGQAAEAEVAKFLYNSTVGVLGFGNPSKKYAELNPDPEDLGQTLGVHGIGEGFYIVWPVLGPSTLRDSIGMLGNTLLKPVTYVDPPEASLAINAYDYVNRYSFRIEDLDAFMEASFDPYEAARDLYIQSRQGRIRR